MPGTALTVPLFPSSELAAMVAIFASGRLPDTSEASATALNDGAPAALPCSTVVAVPSEASGAGAAPAPPPSTSALAVSAPDAAHEVPLLK